MLHHRICRRHTIPQRHILRCRICVPYYRAYLIGIQILKRVLLTRLCRLRCITLVPVRTSEKIAYLKHLAALPRLHRKPALTDEFSGLFKYHRPETKTPFFIPLDLPVKPPLCQAHIKNFFKIFFVKEAVEFPLDFDVILTVYIYGFNKLFYHLICQFIIFVYTLRFLLCFCEQR